MKMKYLMFSLVFLSSMGFAAEDDREDDRRNQLCALKGKIIYDFLQKKCAKSMEPENCLLKAGQEWYDYMHSCLQGPEPKRDDDRP